MSGYDVSPGGSPEDVKEAKQDLLNQDLNAGIPVLVGDSLVMASPEPEPEPETPLPAEPLPEAAPEAPVVEEPVVEEPVELAAVIGPEPSPFPVEIPPHLDPEVETESAAPTEELVTPVEPKRRRSADPIEPEPAAPVEEPLP